MALAGGGGVAAAADAGLRLAGRPPCLLPQPRRHRAGRPLLPARLPPANPAAAAAILQRPLRRFRRGAAALPHSAYARPLWRPDGFSGSARLRSPRRRRLLLLLLLLLFRLRRLRPAHARSLPASPSTQQRRRLPARPLGSAWDSPRPPRPYPYSSQPGICYFLPLPVREKRDRSAAILKPGTPRSAKSPQRPPGFARNKDGRRLGRAERGRHNAPSFLRSYSRSAATPHAPCGVQ
ncbi:uncharacterized protein LOC129735871 [Falco cherrug]|uniref:uncharacterized protein LOC129735871 n=1 Tax=Falco cherrug TaxID=345164 RepID=UPI00247A2A54|nr:uncharacterized protein LOC129735871 [Falco cherrug]